MLLGVGNSLHVSAISGDEVDLTLTVTGIVKGAGAAVLKDSVPPLTGEQVWWETPHPCAMLSGDGRQRVHGLAPVDHAHARAGCGTHCTCVEQLRHAPDTAAINGAFPRQLRSIAI